MAKTIKETNPSRLRVTYAEAHRVRSLLLAAEVEKLSTRDVQTLVKILDDVYPAAERTAVRHWHPFLVGLGLGIILILGLILIF